MERTRWTDGWHRVDNNFSYYVENGCLMYGDFCGFSLTPYKKNPKGGYDNKSGIKANKRNYEKLIWK